MLELGTASGHLCFYMERCGADVTAFDLSAKQSVDIVPYARYDYRQHILDYKEHIDKTNNSYWLAHRVYHSRARVVYGTVYGIPRGIGSKDICTLGSILLHLRDPFLALQSVARHAKDTIIVTDKVPESSNNGPVLRFLPNASTCEPYQTWWELSPELIIEFLRILGFEDTKLTYHKQLYCRSQPHHEYEFFTVVGQRTVFI